MAYNTLEYLESGKVDFVYNLTTYDYYSLIKNVRSSDRRLSIVNGFLSLLRESKPYFCFEIIYDMDEYVDVARDILNKHYKLDNFSNDLFKSFLNNSSLGLDYLRDNFDNIINKYIDNLDFIFKFMFDNLDSSLSLLKDISISSNLHVRFLFMKYLVLYKYDLIDLFYDDITKYLTSETFKNFEQLSFIKDYMSIRDVCELAYLFFDKDIDYSIWKKFKKFILENYQYNELASHLLCDKKKNISKGVYRFVENEKGIVEFNKDADRLFLTSSNYRVNILERYSSCVSKELLESFKQQLLYFRNDGKVDNNYRVLEGAGLVRKLDLYVDKYLSLSSDTSYEFVGSGTTASCYRIGNYAFKLIKTKWSYEPIICPDLYLILPNLEEDFIRDNDGVVLAGIEIQKYLSKEAKNVPDFIFGEYTKELNRLGYYTTDTLINGVCGDNCRLLDSYLDSGNLNAPEWFKDYPLVLVDRDRVYKTRNKSPKQLMSGY